MKILICVLMIVSFVDILYYKIPNLWIGIGMAAGLLLTAREDGMMALPKTVVFLFAIFLVFYLFYLSGGLGAGDVKLFIMLGSFLEGMTYVRCLLVAMLFAGIWAVIKIVRHREGRERLCYLGRYCKKAVVTGVLDEYEVDKGNKKGMIRLSIPVLISVLLLYGGFYS